MREILFRGKSVINEWVEGFYTCFNGDEHRIYTGYSDTDGVDHYPEWCNIRPETVGQYTGLTDKNGTKIFEGDILLKGFEKVVVKWNENQCRWGIYLDEYEISGFNESTKNYFEVIGNIYDNPELLKGE